MEFIEPENSEGPFIILFTSPTRGTVVWSENGSRKAGDYDDMWASSQFRDYVGGVVTLQNDPA